MKHQPHCTKPRSSGVFCFPHIYTYIPVMKKILLILPLLFLSVVTADSPITSTDFYKAYLHISEVEEANKVGVLSDKIAQYLLDSENSLDKKAAVINALSWDIDRKINAFLFKKYLKAKYQIKDDIDSLIQVINDEELFCLGYITVMDNYFSPENSLIYFDSTGDSIRQSYTFQIINALVKTQSLLEDQDKWCRIWTTINAVETNKELKVDMNTGGRKIILDYIKIYKDNCEIKGVKKI